MSRRLVLLALLLLAPLAGCSALGPSSRGPAGERPRCVAPGTRDSERPLYFIFCAESP